MSEQFIYLDLRDPHPQYLGTIAVSTIVCSILPRLLTPRGSFWCTEPIHGPSSQAITGHFIPRAIVTMVDGDVLLSCIVHLESDVVLPRSWRHISRPRRPRLNARNEGFKGLRFPFVRTVCTLIWVCCLPSQIASRWWCWSDRTGSSLDARSLALSSPGRY